MTFAIPENRAGLTMYHVGLVVPDLGEAVERYSSLFGFKFAGRKEIPMTVRVDGVPRKVEIHATYSQGDAPYLELIEEKYGSTWAQEAFGINHVGFWARDVAASIEKLERGGFPARVTSDTDPPRISYHQGPDGLWIEMVGLEVQQTLAAWLATDWS